LAAYHKIPAIYPQRLFAEIGGLITYGASLTDAAARRSMRPSRACAHTNALRAFKFTINSA
jgi:hypothetical protein